MDLVSSVVWVFAAIGWMGDWATTVYPDDSHPETNPFVVQHFGTSPSPLWFGIAKVGSLALIALLSFVLDSLMALSAGIPDSVMGLQTVLVVPIVVGIVGWHATIHNLRLLLD